MNSHSILLVQQSTESAAHLRSLLESRGYTVVGVPDPSTAMQVAHSSDIALVVTDLYLPIGKSRCLARVMAKSPELHQTKILAYTAHGKRRDRAWARRIGADGYVITRSGEERFLSVVDHLLVTPSTPRRTAPRPEELS